MFKLNTKFDADSLLYLLSHFECHGHTVHMLTQWRLLPPLTSAVKSSLFTHAHSSPLSLAAGLHQCRGNCSHYITNDWTFSRQTSYHKKYCYKRCLRFYCLCFLLGFFCLFVLSLTFKSLVHFEFVLVCGIRR